MFVRSFAPETQRQRQVCVGPLEPPRPLQALVALQAGDMEMLPVDRTSPPKAEGMSPHVFWVVAFFSWGGGTYRYRLNMNICYEVILWTNSCTIVQTMVSNHGFKVVRTDFVHPQ